MYPDRAEVGVLAQPCERLEDAPKPGAPLLAMFSHMVPVSSGPGAIIWPHSVSSSASASAVSPEASRASSS